MTSPFDFNGEDMLAAGVAASATPIIKDRVQAAVTALRGRPSDEFGPGVAKAVRAALAECGQSPKTRIEVQVDERVRVSLNVAGCRVTVFAER